MSLIRSKLSSTVLVTLLTGALSLVSIGKAHAQSTRPFQISLWECCGGHTPTSADTDIRSFGYAGSQPAMGPSILINPPVGASLKSASVSNWSQIAAVEVDEPYRSVDKDLFVFFHLLCGSPSTSKIAAIDTALSQMAAELKALNPKARFWVNFTSTEASYMQRCSGVQAFNRAYVDVISYDDYGHYLSSTIYDYIAANRATPSQQLALFPGVFTQPANQSSQLPYLSSYFNYADNANQTCNLPLGSRGSTGIYDGCPVWIVMGWMTGDYEGYRGMLDGSSVSQPILTAWQTELALPSSAQQARAKILPPILRMLLQ